MVPPISTFQHQQHIVPRLLIALTGASVQILPHVTVVDFFISRRDEQMAAVPGDPQPICHENYTP